MHGNMVWCRLPASKESREVQRTETLKLVPCRRHLARLLVLDGRDKLEMWWVEEGYLTDLSNVLLVRSRLPHLPPTCTSTGATGCIREHCYSMQC